MTYPKKISRRLKYIYVNIVYLYKRLLLSSVPGDGGALERGPQPHGGVGLSLGRRRRYYLQRARHRVVAEVVARLREGNWER